MEGTARAAFEPDGTLVRTGAVPPGAELLDDLGGVSYRNAAGEGTLRRTYGYRGLPYAVILDRDHWVARSFYRFGGSLDGIREAVLGELEGGGAPAPEGP